jgi:hypothetical protein
MVAKVISGKNIRGVLNYNENKVQQGAAQCILASRFGCQAHELTFSDKLNRFMKLTALNPKVKTNALHISLNFDASEKLTDEKLKVIACDYMERIGFGNQPFLVYRHQDAAHPHIHIITTNVQNDGKRIDIHNIGRNQSERARKEIEMFYGLVQAESRNAARQSIRSADIEKAVYGKSETKRTISNIVNAVVRQYKFTSLPELNAVLRQFNVIADQGSERSTMRRKNGLLYSIVNQNGEKVGIPVKASAIYGKPTLAFLEKQFALNEKLRLPFRDRMKKMIDRALLYSRTGDDLVRLMSKINVKVLFRVNPQGRVYGVTFIDNKSKVVFNGSDLGKGYAAEGILRRLEDNATNWKERQQGFYPGDKGDKQFDSEMDQMIKDLFTANATDFTSPEAPMKKRRRKKKKKGRSI